MTRKDRIPKSLCTYKPSGFVPIPVLVLSGNPGHFMWHPNLDLTFKQEYEQRSREQIQDK